jgi:ADP-ribosyl-[dinitrogen reductase] hydrolase
MDRRSRYRGAMLGHASGDALGTTLEFRSPGTFEPIDDIVGGGPFGLKAGEWTDDTTMALCLAESLIECNGFDPVHQLQTYCRWLNDGHLSVKGRCFDIGFTTRAALDRFARTGQSYCGSTSESASGNGSIMRLAPVPLYFANDRELAVRMAGESSRTTHGSVQCVDACRLMAAIIVGALDGRPKAEILAEGYWKSLGIDGRLDAKIEKIAEGYYKAKEPPLIKGSGYVVQSLEAALWAFHKTSNFAEGALLAVNLGDDADTTGAVYGQIAGAFYGEEGIISTWREKLAMRELIERRADELYASAQGHAP